LGWGAWSIRASTAATVSEGRSKSAQSKSARTMQRITGADVQRRIPPGGTRWAVCSCVLSPSLSLSLSPSLSFSLLLSLPHTHTMQAYFTCSSTLHQTHTHTHTHTPVGMWVVSHALLRLSFSPYLPFSLLLSLRVSPSLPPSFSSLHLSLALSLPPPPSQTKPET
jgi:hypothetical protein